MSEEVTFDREQFLELFNAAHDDILALNNKLDAFIRFSFLYDFKDYTVEQLEHKWRVYKK